MNEDNYFDSLDIDKEICFNKSKECYLGSKNSNLNLSENEMNKDKIETRLNILKLENYYLTEITKFLKSIKNNPNRMFLQNAINNYEKKMYGLFEKWKEDGMVFNEQKYKNNKDAIAKTIRKLNTVKNQSSKINLSENNNMDYQRFNEKEKKLILEKFKALVSACKQDVGKMQGSVQMLAINDLSQYNLELLEQVHQLLDENNLTNYEYFDDVIGSIDAYEKKLEYYKSEKVKPEFINISKALSELKNTMHKNTKMTTKQIDEMLDLEIVKNTGVEMAFSEGSENFATLNIDVDNPNSERNQGTRMAVAFNSQNLR